MPKEYKPEEIREAIRQSEGVISDAAKTLGCSRKTIYNHIDKDELTELTKDIARQKRVGKFRRNVEAIADDLDHKDSFKANVKALEVWDQEFDWSGKQRIETSGTVTINLMEENG